MTETINPLTERCRTCDKKVSLVAEWLPHPGGGIRHAFCEVECHAGDGPILDDYELGFPDDFGNQPVWHKTCFDAAVKENW